MVLSPKGGALMSDSTTTTKHCPYCGRGVLLSHRPACDLADDENAHAEFLASVELGVAELPTAQTAPTIPVVSSSNRSRLVSLANKALVEAGAHIAARRGTIDPATRALYNAVLMLVEVAELDGGVP